MIVRSPNNTALPPTNYTVVAGTPTIIDYTTVIPALGAKLGGLQNTFRNTVLNDAGLIITSDEPIAVYFKPNRSNNQEIIPLKGITGLGTTFRAASQTSPRQPGCGDNFEENSHFISVMATEDNTTVTFDNPNPGGFEGIANPSSFTLDEGESVMVQTPLGSVNNKLTGTLVTSNRPISVTSGGQHIGAFDAGACDAGIDNLVPIEEIGTEYIFARGNSNPSSTSHDYAVIVAHFDNTDVFVNGTLQGNINAGEFLNYVTPAVPFGSPFYVQTSQPAYVFHVSSRGNNEMGMSLLPRIICTGNRFINFPRQTGLVNGVYVIIPTSAIPSFQFNGQGIGFYSVTPIPVPTLPTWSLLNFGDSDISANNIMTADESFHVGLLGNAGTQTGLYGFLSSYNIDIQSFNPDDNLPTSSYVIEDVCINEAFVDTLLIRSCAPPNVIDSFTLVPSNAGVVQIEPQISPDNPVYSFLANPGVYSGPSSITFYISNTLGHQTQVTTNFLVNNPPQILAGFPIINCISSDEYTIEGDFSGTPPFTASGTGAPGTWTGNSWVSDPILNINNYSVTVTDVNQCSPPFDFNGVGCVADLSIIKVVDNNSPNVGDSVIFTLTVSNSGPRDATNVEVNDLLPSGFNYVSDNGSGAYSNATGIWTIGNLANGASVNLEITATVLTTGDYKNIARVEGLETDLNPNNNVDGVEVEPICDVRNITPSIGN